MRPPQGSYQIQQLIAQHLPNLRPAQQRGLALWVHGTLQAHSACQNAVTTALLPQGRWDGLRQYLREWLYDGPDKAAPNHTQVEVQACFAPVLRWLRSWWQDHHLALAIDATLQGDRVAALVVSVLYRGLAIPVAWRILPANQPGAWMPAILELLRLLAPAVPPHLTVLVLADRGLWSPRLWQQVRDLGWHPLLRVQKDTLFQPAGGQRRAAWCLVPGPGHAWVGRGTAFRDRQVQRQGTLVVVWAHGQQEPWVALTDLAPRRVG